MTKLFQTQKHNTKSGHKKKVMILHLLLKSLFLSLRGFYLVQHTKLLQFASPFWTNKITGDLASPRFSPI